MQPLPARLHDDIGAIRRADIFFFEGGRDNLYYDAPKISCCGYFLKKLTGVSPFLALKFLHRILVFDTVDKNR